MHQEHCIHVDSELFMSLDSDIFHFYGISHNAKMVLLCVALLAMTSKLFITAEICLIHYTIQTFGVSNLAWMFF